MLAVFHAPGSAEVSLACTDKAQPVGTPQKVKESKNACRASWCSFAASSGVLVRESTTVHRSPGT